MWSKPLGMFYFNCLRFHLRVGPAAKKYFHLAWFFERARREYFNVVNVEPDLFVKFTSERLFGLFVEFEKTARDAPATAGAKAMF